MSLDRKILSDAIVASLSFNTAANKLLLATLVYEGLGLGSLENDKPVYGEKFDPEKAKLGDRESPPPDDLDPTDPEGKKTYSDRYYEARLTAIKGQEDYAEILLKFLEDRMTDFSQGLADAIADYIDTAEIVVKKGQIVATTGTALAQVGKTTSDGVGILT